MQEEMQPIIFSDINEFSVGKNFFYSLTADKTKKLQKTISKFLQEKIDLNNSVTSYRKGYSYFDFLLPHKANYHFTRLDIRSFFHSIREEDVRYVLNEYFFDQKISDTNQKIIDAFINLVMLDIPESSLNEYYHGKKILPMGFTTSPVISNIVFRPIDIRIQKLCDMHGIIYTRYADDMLFSLPKNSDYIFSENFLEQIAKYLAHNNFRLNKQKQLMKKHTLSLNGYVISNGEIRLSNKKISIIFKLIYMCEQYKQGNSFYKPTYIMNKLFNYSLPFKYPPKGYTFDDFYNDQVLNKLTGFRSFLLSILIFDQKNNVLRKENESFINNNQTLAIEKYSLLLARINALIESW
ncbi:reverse transcriptase family protein [Sulfurimonas sp. ST-25]|uniref:reverse transcriptase family protein n=1 Tax=Sulfurimonas sp. ST-25 TaxID=3400151 RepID=UPI003A8C58F7